MRAAVYGYGRAGASLARTLPRAGVQVVAVGARGEPARSRAAADHPGAHIFTDIGSQAWRDVDVLFLAVTDRSVSDVARALATTEIPRAVVHLAGSRGLAALEPLEGLSALAMFHPLASLDGHGPIPSGTVVGIETVDLALASRLEALAQAAGLLPWTLRPGQAVRYHAAATIAANHPVALFDVALQLLDDVGVRAGDARRGLARLLRSVADNLEQRPPAEALTGAVARGDIDTVHAHLRAVAHRPDAHALYRALSTRLLPVAGLDHETEDALLRLLASGGD